MGDPRPFWLAPGDVASSIHDVNDAALDAVSKQERARLAGIWALRAGMEVQVAGAFAVVSRELFEHGAERTVVEIVARAVSDELAHASICLELAARHDGQVHPWPKPEPLFVPSYEGAKGSLEATLHLVALSCLNETIASVRLAKAADESESVIVSRGLRAILRDEIEHARAGWAHLASRFVSPSDKREIERRLPTLVSASLRGLLEENESLAESAHPELGLPSLGATRAIAEETIRDVIAPGFQRLGIAYVAELAGLSFARGASLNPSPSCPTSDA